MDFMFEDEVDEVGSDVEAYCPKCKGDTTHVVISKYEDEIRRVQCNPCGDVHSFRKPRGDVEDDVPEPIAAKKRAMMKKPTFDEFFAKHSDKNAKPYEFREHYHENVIVTHPKFGKGFVSEIMSDSKVEMTFKDSRRVLVHNRRDMPGLPLAAEGDGIHDANSEGAIKARSAEARQGRSPTRKPERRRQAVAATRREARQARPAAKAPKPPGVAAKPPAAKVAKRTAKPARPARIARSSAPTAAAKRPPRSPSAARSRPRSPAHRSPCGRPAAPRPGSGSSRAGSLADEQDVEVVEGVGVDDDGEAAEPEDEAEEDAGEHTEDEHPEVQRIPVGGMWCIAENSTDETRSASASAIQRAEAQDLLQQHGHPGHDPEAEDRLLVDARAQGHHEPRAEPLAARSPVAAGQPGEIRGLRHHEDDQRPHRQRVDRALEHHRDDQPGVEVLLRRRTPTAIAKARPPRPCSPGRPPR